MGFIPAIEGLRGVAILLVIVSHVGLGDAVPVGFGVTLFFFISGFLITSLLLHEQAQTGDIALGAFYARRFLRLAPELLTMICVVSVVCAFIGHAPHRGELLAAAFYMTNYFVLLGGTLTLPLISLWSLAVEEHYYLLYPLILRKVGGNPRRLLIGMIALVVAVLLWRTILVFVFHCSDDRTYFATDTRIDSIIYGAILSVLTRMKAAEYLTRWYFLVGAVALLGTFLIRNDAFRQTLRFSLQGIALLPLFYAAVFADRLPLKRILESAPMLLIGRLSYSLYLWHFPVVMLVGQYTKWPAAAAIPIFSAIAACSYYFIEARLTPLRKRLHGRPQHRGAVVPAAAIAARPGWGASPSPRDAG